MCLAVPGKVLEIAEGPQEMSLGKVSFGGVIKEVCLACLPEVKVGDYVLVHVGFALSRIDEEEAQEVFRILEKMAELSDRDDSLPAGTNPSP
jgi:hydrogenase expression/formation protein HypC